MNLAELTVMFGLGLVSSLHCVQMCGPLVISFSLPLANRGSAEQFLAHLAYHSGRIITYAILGGLAGLAGQSLRLVGDLAGIENLVTITSGGMMLIAGLLMLELIPSQMLARFDLVRHSTRLLKPLGRRISSPDPRRKFLLGMLLGLLPCGLIYAALIKAISTVGIVSGALTMAAFGMGTVGSLLLLGLFSSTVLAKLGRGSWSPRLTAVSVMLLGVFLLYRGLTPHLPGSGGAGAPGCHAE
ncbi:MAG: sulfite exporter TauE/SafE family protein [Acidobacteriota bacterium]